MENVRFAGLDVHASSIAIAVAEGGSREGARVIGTLPNDAKRVVKQLEKLGGPKRVRVCYEAGPTGYGLCRELRARGYVCAVVAPSLVPTKSGDRVKTDRRDAEKLAHFFRSGDLTEVYVPSPESEAMRDLSRTREDAKEMEQRARQQLGTFLLRHGMRYAGKRWTDKHLRWVESLPFSREAQVEVRNDYLKTVRDAAERVKALIQKIEAEVERWEEGREVVQALRAMRGVDLVTAVGVVAEIGSFVRFATAKGFMAYLGLTPSEHSSGESKRRGGITKCGNRHVRRLLVESAWAYRFPANMSREIQRRNLGVPATIRRHAWKAQGRLHARYVKLELKGKAKPKVIATVARELAGFMWAIGREAEETRLKRVA